MQRQRSPLQPVVESVTSKDHIRVKNECILFSQSIMSGRWNPSTNVHAAESTPTNLEGPEPRILSKKRRDLINAEIRELQNLLPLKKSARERLSYLGILALTNTFIRKATFFKKECISCDASMSSGLVSEFTSSLCGFLLVFNREGKILYSSENILDYLGNTVVELASQGDSIYDFVDKEDHDQVRAQLEVPPHDDRGEARKLSFFCRMATSRYMKTQMRSWKNKIIHVTGKYHRPEMSNDWSDTVFVAVCTPIESKPVTDVRHHPSPRACEFKAVHGPDMKFLEVPNTVESLLGYKPDELENTSWYDWIYPEDLGQARQQHLKFVKEDGSAFACVLRMIRKDGSAVWMDITAEKSQESIGNSFICNYIVIDEEEVPYFRIHHNLLPFPDHYTDSQRQYLAYRSTLLSAALSNDANSAGTSPLTSPTSISQHDLASAHIGHPMYGDNLDTKSILRRQLIKRKMSSLDSPLCSPQGSYPGDMFSVPPNKMLIRTASEINYTNTPYHVPLHHSTSYPEASYHSHVAYRQAPEDSFLSQLHSPSTATPPYLYEGGYTTLAAVRPQSLTLRQSQRSPDANINSSSPLNGHKQQNQNNNAHINVVDPYYSRSQAFANQQYSPTPSNCSSGAGSPYYQPGMSPCSLSPRSPVLNNQGPLPSKKLVQNSRPSVDGLFRDVSDIIDGELVSDPGHYMVASPEPAHRSPYHISQQSSPRRSTVQHYPGSRAEPEMRQIMGSYGSPEIRSSLCQLKEEVAGSPIQYNAMSPCSNQNSPTNSVYSNYDDNCYSPERVSPEFGVTSCAEVQRYQDTVSGMEKPYHVQYSISTSRPTAMQQYQAAAAAFYAAHQRSDVEGGSEWVKKYGNMSAMEMLFSESDGQPYLA
ncbi:uncharacterized protein LOC100183663 isoform X2 [Ciona intestinalis]